MSGMTAQAPRRRHAGDEIDARFCVAAGLTVAWLVTVFFSGVFSNAISSVTQATTSTSAFCLATLASIPLALRASHATCRIGEIDKLALPLGYSLLSMASLLTFLGLHSLHPLALPITFGALAGTGTACLAAPLLDRAASLPARICLPSCAIAYAGGTCVALIIAWAVPTELHALVTSALPCCAMAACALMETRPYPGSLEGSLRGNLLRSALDHHRFSLFSLLSGFLFSYCYSVYPKTTRFAGVYVDALFGTMSHAAVAQLLLAGALLPLIVGSLHRFKKNRTLVASAAFAVSFSILFFNLPGMPSNRITYVVLGVLSLYVETVALIGVAIKWSGSDKRGVERLAINLTGMCAGSVIGMSFIELTTENPIVIIPVTMRDAIIVGVPSFGYLLLMVCGLALAQDSAYPRGAKADATLNLTDLTNAAELLSKEHGLTARESEILTLLLHGRSGPYIAEDLYLSKSTVKTHIRHIYQKLAINSRQQLLDEAHEIAAQAESGHSTARNV